MRSTRHKASLAVRRMGIETQQEYVVYMHHDCHVCRSEGFEAQTRVLVSLNGRSIIATLNVVDPCLLELGEAALSNSAWRALGPVPGDRITVSHAPALDSMSQVRAKIYGHRLDASALDSIIGDVAAGSYPGTHIAAFLSACAGGRMDLQETIDLTRAMLAAGERLDWGHSPIADKHCVGGLPGNRTTPIVVSIITAAGLTMPKTSSRAITSPAGTADVMETMTPVALDLEQMRCVVEREGGCFVWGGSLALSPADDMLIRVERPLDLDSDAQLVASVLSKKIAAGATHSVIDVPVGPTAKVRSDVDYECLKQLLEQVAQACGLHLQVVRTVGTEPVGRGIGPSLEARDVLAVLQGAASAPVDLGPRAVALAGQLLEFCGHSERGAGVLLAQRLLDSGAAWAKFQAICEAQGGLREPRRARLHEPVLAEHEGLVRAIDSRRLARVAKLAGAPKAPAAGLELHVKLGDRVEQGMPLFTVHAEAPGELDYAFDYLAAHPLIDVGEPR
ncbi:thymidine phosphorylase family protein [Burkholderia pseudomultivorans]|uniref:thymidine phosphorylase family protein n=1 Tax=Burkholderia pseudomultivorans TaxID=1207504 RepID=UPI00188DFB27|nr:thymidine phosphorylase family protein [Burkholderia pseudomultivorans]MBF5008699.1 thymidine phosphorylase family protein [Burkholderia pseudomultivorans]